MEAIIKTLVAATLVWVHAAPASGQTSNAVHDSHASSAVTGQAAQGERTGGAGPAPGFVRGDHAALPPSELNKAPADGSGAHIPTDGGVQRGGPENPSGLRKPD